jgi:hypothetical protein
MAMPAVVAFDAHGLAFGNHVQMRRNLLAVGGEVVGAKQQDVPPAQPFQQALQRGSITSPAFPVNKAQLQRSCHEPPYAIFLIFCVSIHNTLHSTDTNF